MTDKIKEMSPSLLFTSSSIILNSKSLSCSTIAFGLLLFPVVSLEEYVTCWELIDGDEDIVVIWCKGIRIVEAWSLCGILSIDIY